MMSTKTPRAVLEELVTRICLFRDGDDDQVEALSNLYAEDAEVTHPFLPLGDPDLHGRDALRRHFSAGSGVPRESQSSVENLVIHETGDPEVVIGEFAYVGHFEGKPLNTRCIFVVRVRNGEIIESRDYVDHLASMRTSGTLDTALTSLLTGSSRD